MSWVHSSKFDYITLSPSQRLVLEFHDAKMVANTSSWVAFSVDPVPIFFGMPLK